jgi:hypothetical protein
MHLSFVASSFIFMSAVLPSAQDTLPTDVLNELKDATALIHVRAKGSESSGCGLLVEKRDAEGFVVTSAQVVAREDAEQIECVFVRGGQSDLVLTARLMAHDSTRDLAVLRVVDSRLPTPIGTQPEAKLRDSSPAFVIGFPRTDAAAGKRSPAHVITRATISDIRRDDPDRVSSIRLEAEINSANLGGPVVDKTGSLIGLATANSSNAEINRVIPAGYLQDLMLGRITDIEIKLSGQKSGSNFNYLTVRVSLLDPMNRIGPIGLKAIAKAKLPNQIVPPDDGKWSPVAPDMTGTSLDRRKDYAESNLVLRNETDKPPVYLLQMYHKRDGAEIYAAPIEIDIRRISTEWRSISKPFETQKSNRGALTVEATGPRVIDLPGAVRDVVAGAGGRYLVLQLQEDGTLIVFDTKQSILSEPVKAPINALLAAGQEKLIVVDSFNHKLERRSIAQATKEKEASIPVSGMVKAIGMGCASRGPLLISWAKGTSPLDQASFSLMDINSLKITSPNYIDVHHENQPRREQPGSSGEFKLRNTTFRDQVEIRAAGNGDVFGLWATSHSPSGLETFSFRSGVGLNLYHHESVGHVVPTIDGKGICTEKGYYTSDLARNRKDGICIPSYDAKYYLVLNGPKEPLTGSLIEAKSGDIALRLPSLGDMKADATSLGNRLTIDKRFHCYPQAHLLITIPPGNDRLLLYTLDESTKVESSEPQAKPKVKKKAS